MSSLNKIVINGGKALDSRRSLASRAGSRRNTPAVSSARNSQRSRRNMEMLVKRVETRSGIIKKAFGEIKKVHPNEMSYESLKNCVVRYKLPLSKDAVRMLFEHARSANSLTEGSQQKASMLDLGKTIVSGRGENFSFRSINADQRGGIPAAEKQSSSKKNASTDRVLSLLQESIFPKVEKLLKTFSAAKFNRLNEPNSMFSEALSHLDYLKIPFDVSTLRNIFFVGTADSNTNRRGGSGRGGVDVRGAVAKLKKSLRYQWQELQRSVDIISASGKVAFISFQSISRLFQKHYLGIGESEIGDMVDARKTFLEQQGALDDSSAPPGFDIVLLPNLVSACMERQWKHALKALESVVSAIVGASMSLETEAELSTVVSRTFHKYRICLSEREVSFLIRSPDLVAPISKTVDLREFNEDEGRGRRRRAGVRRAGVGKRAPIPLPSQLRPPPRSRQQRRRRGAAQPSQPSLLRSFSTSSFQDGSSFQMPNVPKLNLGMARVSSEPALYNDETISWEDDVLGLCD
eukprot:g2046.t1